MPHTTHFSPVALSYARSVLELANERDQQQEAIGAELRDLRQIVDTNPTFAKFLADPAVGEVEKSERLKRIFGGRVSKLVLDFIGVLNEKGRLDMLTEIIGAYEELLDEQMAKVEVDVTVAQKLSAEQLETVRQRVSTALKKDAVVHQYVDESIIGGLILRVQDQLIDGSVRHQLQAIKEKLMSGKTQIKQEI